MANLHSYLAAYDLYKQGPEAVEQCFNAYYNHEYELFISYSPIHIKKALDYYKIKNYDNIYYHVNNDLHELYVAIVLWVSEKNSFKQLKLEGL